MHEGMPLEPWSCSFVLPGVPLAWARAGTRDGRHYTPTEQADFMAQLKTVGAIAMRGTRPLNGPVELSIRATFTRPKSKNRSDVWKDTKPDADNLSKIIKDALQGIAWVNDSRIASLHIYKTYGERAELAVIIRALA